MGMTTSRRLKHAIFHICAVSLGFLMIYPFLYMIFGSFKTQQDIVQNPTSLLPASWTLENFFNGWKGFGNTTFATFF